MHAESNGVCAIPRTIAIAPKRLSPSPFSLSIYGDATTQIDDLLPSIREQGILVALIVAPEPGAKSWQVISGHRRLACALALGLPEVPCEVRILPPGNARQRAILDYNRQRCKTFSHLMREADALQEIWGVEAKNRRLKNLRRIETAARFSQVDCRTSDARNEKRESSEAVDSASRSKRGNVGRTDSAIAGYLGMGGKDLYRQARAIWHLAQSGDSRALSAVAQLDAGTKTIHAAHKDLRRRDCFSANFRPTPYDVWSFRHNRAFGMPHPGAIPAAIVAHTLHYYTPPGALVVDPMAGGGTTLDVCQSMGRRCLAYDIHPSRPQIQAHDIRLGFPLEAAGCDLIFCDPPYHTMLAHKYPSDTIASAPLTEWIAFLHNLAGHAFATLRSGGFLALLLATQTEKDVPAGFGYLDHGFLGYIAATRAGFFPERRISCPMDGAYLPQHVRRARVEGRLLGQVRDLLIMRKPDSYTGHSTPNILFMQGTVVADQQDERQA
jgi:ParB family transcriptional regulator, chromosome partitioning protein